MTRDPVSAVNGSRVRAAKRGREMRRRIAAPQLMVCALAVVVAGALAVQLLIWGPGWWRPLSSRRAGPRLR